MNSIKQMIRTGVAALCAVCLLSACSSTLDEALDGGNTAQALTNIQIGDFPAFGSEANNGIQTRSAAIGTYDEGKTTWTNGDEILLKITDSKSVVTTATLVYNGTTWAPKETLEVGFGSATIEAYYAPAYEWSNKELALKEGKSAGTEEFLTYSATQDLTKGLSIEFGNRNYSRLRVATDPGMSVTFTAADFTPVAASQALGTNTITATADEKGNSYFYGTWTAESSATIKTPKTYGFCKKDFTLPTATSAKSYAVAGQKWIIDASCYYLWDAYSYVTNGSNSFSEGNYGYHTGNATDITAEHSCVSCPTAPQMVAYLKAGVYWDDNTTVTDGMQTYSAPNGESGKVENKHTGLWVKKKSVIGADFYNEADIAYTTTADTFKKLSTLTEADVRNIRTGGDYFFLPAAGFYYFGFFYAAGSFGYYWAATPFGSDTATAYRLSFYDGYAFVNLDSRGYGYLPLVAE